MKKFNLFLLVCFFVISGFLFLPKMAKAEEIIISNDTVWDSGDVKIFHDDDSLTIDDSVTLTITNGTILKMGKNTTIAVGGRLVINGTSEKPVIITSIKDDSVGGDSDGVVDQPSPGDWYGIISGPGSGVDINYAIVEYGGKRLDMDAGVITTHPLTDHFYINHSSIINNSGQIFDLISNFKINNSNIYNPGFCSDLGGIDFCGTILINQTPEEIDLTNNYWGHQDGPTVAYPDIKGTIISGPANSQPYVSKPIELFKKGINPVILIPGILGSWKLGDKYELDPILNTYDNLWEALKLAGYEEGKTLFAFPYDWRFSNASNTDDLMRKVQEVKEISGSDRVDIIGHSMGGLLARSYIESIYYKNDVDKLVFLATPHKGAVDAYLAWEGGELSSNPNDFVKKYIFELEANRNHHQSIFDYIREDIPSIRDLLPIYDYLKEHSSGQLRTYPNNYPQNYFLELLNRPENMKKLDDVSILNIIANDRKNDTLNYIKVEDKEFDNAKWENGYPHNYDSVLGDHGLEFGPGDETVPQMSNDGLFFDEEVTMLDTTHGDVVTDAQKYVIEFLTGKMPIMFIKTNSFSKYFIIRIFSPADFLITAPDGKELGRNSLGQNINEIHGAFYYNEDEMEFALIPEPIEGKYRIDLLGTDDGQYRLSLAYIDDQNNNIEKEFKGNISVGQKQDFKIDYVSSTDPLGDLNPQDFDAPIINIASPVSSTPYYRLQKLNIEYTTKDDFPGLATTTLAIDNQSINTTTIDLFNYSVGKHDFTVTASDLAGNISSLTVEFSIITDLKNMILGINGLYKRKLISKEAHNKLLPPLGQLQLKLKAIDVAIDILNKAKGQIGGRLREKLIKEAGRAIARLEKERDEIIDSKLDNFNKQLANLLRQNKIKQKNYDIIKADSDYLKINL
ncbi:MAG: alpha/beta fold hydrolase [Candidatus Buchananbacteria bacterium]